MGLFSGFCSLVGSCISGACSAVSSFVSGAVGALGNMVSSLGGAVGKLIGACVDKLGAIITSVCVSVLGPVLGPIVAQLIMAYIKKTVMDLAKKVLGLDDKPEEVGYRIKEAEEHPEDFRRPEEFPSLEDYYKYLKSEIKIDKEKLEAHKLEYEALGISTLSVAIGEKLGIELTGDFLGEIGICNLSTDEVIAITQVFRDLGYSRVALGDYLQGKIENPEDKLHIRDGIIAKLIENGLTEDAAFERLNQMRLCSNDVNQMVDIAYPEARKMAEMGENAPEYIKFKDRFGKYAEVEK